MASEEIAEASAGPDAATLQASREVATRSQPAAGLDLCRLILLVGAGLAYFEYGRFRLASVAILVLAFILAIIVSYAIKIADQWEKTIVLRLGRFRSLEGPGLFFIIPDHRDHASNT